MDNKVYTQIPKQMFQISAQAKSTYVHESLQYSSMKKMYDIYKYKQRTFLSIFGFRKQRPDMDMSNNYDLLCCF